MKKKLFISVVAVALVACFAIGGTLAWLADSTKTVTNTFTVGDIDITLAETTGDEYKVTPGTDIKKDPKVTVLAGSEDCWLFVKVDKANWSEGLGYTIADGWTELEEGSGVYYREVANNASNQEFYVLTNNEVTVSEDLTKSDLEAMNTNQPSLAFTAYAVQQENLETPAEAWAAVNAE